MSVQRFIMLVCDAEPDCGEESEAEMTETQARRRARRDGWRVGRNRDQPDYCPNHARGAP